MRHFADQLFGNPLGSKLRRGARNRYCNGMNPYARQLGTRDPLKVVATTARHLEQLSVALGPARIEESPAPGKWSPHEILCHLADCELVFSYRIRQALAEDHHVIQPFDQEVWARELCRLRCTGCDDDFLLRAPMEPDAAALGASRRRCPSSFCIRSVGR